MNLIAFCETFEDREKALQKITFVKNAHPVSSKILVFLNFNLYREAKRLNLAFHPADHIVIRDGIAMSLIMRFFGLQPKCNLNGTDFIPFLLDHYNWNSVGIIGSKGNTAEKCARIIEKKYGKKVCFSIDGFQAWTDYSKIVQHSDADILIIGTGNPRQEDLAQFLITECSKHCLIICGGAILDFMAGNVKRAPVLIRKFRLEWFYRMMLEPRRLYFRYFFGFFEFLFYVARDYHEICRNIKGRR